MSVTDIPIDISKSKINVETLAPLLIYSKPIRYKNWIFKPIIMKDYIEFMQWQQALTIRKNSTFREKELIKMSYRKLLRFCFMNESVAMRYNMPFLMLAQSYWFAIIQHTCCGVVVKNHKTNNTSKAPQDVLQAETIKYDVDVGFDNDGFVTINGHTLTDKECNDIRRLIICQNGVDFDVDEFINYETEQALNAAMEKNRKNKGDLPGVEDYIDSFIVSQKISEEEVMQMPARKFWRYITRLNRYDDYKIRRMGESSGLVKYKEPLVHWMAPIDGEDEYESVKTSKSELDKTIRG